MVPDSFGQFLHFLERATCQPGSFTGTALLIKEPWSRTSASYILKELRIALPIKYLQYERSDSDKLFTTLLSYALAERCSVFIEVLEALSEEMIGLIQQIHIDRSISFLDPLDSSRNTVRLCPKVKLVLFIEREILEAQVSKTRMIPLCSSVLAV